jgi:thiamine-phosphate pyrophosphorylase
MPVHLPGLCIVTRARGRDGSVERAALLDRLAEAAEAGATMVQVRERQFDDRDLLTFLQQLIARVRPLGTQVTVNDRTDLALAAGADGVHLKSHAPQAPEVRRIVPDGFLIGRSVHSEEESAAVEAAGGCDYLLFGTVFPSASKPADHPVAGQDALAAVCRRVRLPVLAIGGITPDRVAAVVDAGAAGIAAISLFTDAGNVSAAIRAVRDALTLPARRV